MPVRTPRAEPGTSRRAATATANCQRAVDHVTFYRNESARSKYGRDILYSSVGHPSRPYADLIAGAIDSHRGPPRQIRQLPSSRVLGHRGLPLAALQGGWPGSLALSPRRAAYGQVALVLLGVAWRSAKPAESSATRICASAITQQRRATRVAASKPKAGASLQRSSTWGTFLLIGLGIASSDGMG